MRKGIVLGISILFLGCICAWFAARQRGQVMEVPVISEEKAQDLCDTRAPYAQDESVSLQINGVRAAYVTAEERYYIPKNMEESYWKGTLSASADGESVSVAWLEDSMFRDMEAVISEEHEFRCLINSDTE